MVSREYPARPLVGIGVVVLRPAEVLLVRRGRAPALGQWSLPGGAQRLGETAEEAARRELMEETGLAVGALQLIAHVDSIHRDSGGRIQFHYTILDFVAAWQGGEPQAQGDVTDARFTSLDGLDSLGLWSEAVRVIAAAQRLLSSGAGASETSDPS